MLGLGVVQPGQLGLITGSSHLHLCLSKNSANAPGVWGAYKCAPLPDLNMAEGGQSSTGSTLRWLRGLLGGDHAPSYAELDAEAATIAPGAEGLMAIETFQGSRTVRATVLPQPNPTQLNPINTTRTNPSKSSLPNPTQLNPTPAG